MQRLRACSKPWGLENKQTIHKQKRQAHQLTYQQALEMSQILPLCTPYTLLATLSPIQRAAIPPEEAGHLFPKPNLGLAWRVEGQSAHQALRMLRLEVQR